MDSIRPVYWRQGMFLRPQHFQQQDHYHETRLHQYIHMVQPFCWGVKTLAFNEDALSEFRCEIDRCEVVIRPGTLLYFRGPHGPSNATIPSRTVDPEADLENGVVSVYLGLKRLQPENRNVYVNDDEWARTTTIGLHRRFHAQTTEISDWFADEETQHSVEYLMYDVHMLFEAEKRQAQAAYEIIKIAELVRARGGPGLSVSSRYIPPVLSITASSTLTDLLHGIRRQVTQKAEELAPEKPSWEWQRSGIRQLTNLLMLQTLNRYLPLFLHYLDVDQAHPHILYAMLRQLIGELLTFTAQTAASRKPVPSYKHEEIWKCFSDAARMVGELLNGLTPPLDNAEWLVFDDREEARYFTADLNPEMLQDIYQYYLAIYGELDADQLIKIVASKICSREDMDTVVNNYLPGVELIPLPYPPDELPQGAQRHYYRLNHQNRRWQGIRTNSNIAVKCDDLPPQTPMQIIAVPAS